MIAIERVQLVIGRQNVQNVCQRTNSVLLGRKVAEIWDKSSKGHGRTGQVKKASFFGRSITLLNQKLNRGSLIDFINAANQRLHTFPKKFLDKGNFFTKGASDEEIRSAFEELCKDLKGKNITTLLEEKKEPEVLNPLYSVHITSMEADGIHSPRK